MEAIKKILLTVVLVAGFSNSIAAEDERLKSLSPEDRTWLEEEVVYIILDKERETFLDLETVEERNFFIEAFWRRRRVSGSRLWNGRGGGRSYFPSWSSTAWACCALGLSGATSMTFLN